LERLTIASKSSVPDGAPVCSAVFSAIVRG
jgi:hypothetical protein